MLCCRRIPLTKHTILPSSHLPQLPRTTFLQKAFLLRSSQLSLHQRRYTSTSPPKPPLAARIVSSLPARAKPYAYLARLDKPVGSWLLYWPCGPTPPQHPLTFLAWSITLAAAHAQIPPVQLFSMLGLFGVGAVVMRGAGCTINDLWDRNLDKQVPYQEMGIDVVGRENGDETACCGGFKCLTSNWLFGRTNVGGIGCLDTVELVLYTSWGVKFEFGGYVPPVQKDYVLASVCVGYIRLLK